MLLMIIMLMPKSLANWLSMGICAKDEMLPWACICCSSSLPFDGSRYSSVIKLNPYSLCGENNSVFCHSAGISLETNTQRPNVGRRHTCHVADRRSFNVAIAVGHLRQCACYHVLNADKKSMLQLRKYNKI